MRELQNLGRPDIARALGLEGDQATQVIQAIYAAETRDSGWSSIAPKLAKFFNISLEVLVTWDLTELTKSKISELPPYEAPENNDAMKLHSIPPSEYVRTTEIMELITKYERADWDKRRLIMESVRSISEGGRGKFEGKSPVGN